ncbi:sulfatase-like hydrolase/transferase [Fodinisporobacter ferrooxydans]|uniref:Sulfatase-like hydrolase/transferase n=1 Tax=Fodinisporobacter ferrooxydans TaxID=2901836 RepID=A0ABY4CDX7_9BACL|nr:sulfatase-like hydrolase/transferase [Alicyclobacillaceae bacterium MYW30-H2]
MSKSGPNILFITADQLRADCLRCYGNQIIQTPNIDLIAQNGVQFESAYVANPLCAPSRSSILTGRYPSRHRVWCNGVPLSDHEITLTSILSKNGYHTAVIGKMHFTPAQAPEPEPSFYDSFKNWEIQNLRNWHGPYYGFEEVWMSLGHNSPRGHYRYWLEDNAPDVIDLFGPEHALKPPTEAMQSWKSAVPADYHVSTWIGNTAIDFLKRASENSKPFFAWISFTDPHHPFAPPVPFNHMYDPNQVKTPLKKKDELLDKPPHFYENYSKGTRTEGTRECDVPANVGEQHVREIIAHTYGMISLVDQNIGRILETLDELCLRENTVVIFASDHGDLLGDHGLFFKGPFLYEGLVRVPFIWSFPKEFNVGVGTKSLVSLVDFAPTILDIAGISIPPSMQGKSLVTILNGRQDKVNDSILIEYQSGYSPDLNLRSIRTPKWKLTYYAGANGELYDLENDPGEFINLYQLPAYDSIRNELIKLLLDKMLQIEDRTPIRLSHA